MVLNMGPQHPSTHGVLRLVLELEGETVTQARLVIGYLHTGIEKNVEYRTWTQAVTFLTRSDYLAPLFHETALLPGRGEAARHRGAGAGHDAAGAAHGDQPDLLALGVVRHRRHGARRADRDDQRLPGPRVVPGRAGADHRPPDEPCVRPPRRRRAGPAAGRDGGAAVLAGKMQREIDDLEKLLTGQPIWQAPAEGRRPHRRRRLHRARRHRPAAAGRRAALGPAQGRAVLRLRDLRLRGADLGPRRLAGRATWCAWPRCASR